MRVAFITAVLNQYRVAFHNRVRTLLEAQGIEYRLIQGQPQPSEAAKGDTVTLPWATQITNRAVNIGCGRPLLWQPAWREIASADLVIIGQENRLLINYLLLLVPSRLGPRIALWGHGRNFQGADGLRERWKRLWSTRPHWWFGYTEETRRAVQAMGFPVERITVFNNAIDTGELRASADAVSDEEALAAIRSVGLHGANTSVFVGSLYPDKRIDFLVAAADRVRTQVPDFELVIIGGGVEYEKAKALSAARPWMAVTGPKFGRDKVALMRGAQLFLMPGLVGLAVLDAAAVGLPVVTTAYPHHSPEIAYLDDGITGVIVPTWNDDEAYAEAIIALLKAPGRIAAMSAAAKIASQAFTIEAMADRFAQGVVQALEAPRR